MRHDLSLWIHVAIGSLAMLLFWLTLQSVKGSWRHRRSGRLFLTAMLATVLTVPPVVLLRPVPFDPAWIVSLVYLSVCVGTVVTLAWTSIRWKQQPERFRGLHFVVLGPLLVTLGTVVMLAGVFKADPVAAVLSWVGLAYGLAMIYFARSRAALHPRWWLSWHLSAVCGLFTAVHGTLGFVAWRGFAAPDATRLDAAFWHAGVLVVAVLMRAVVGRQRDLPWGFFIRPAQHAHDSELRAPSSPRG